MTLKKDIARCCGWYSIGGERCEDRMTCKRYLAFSVWDRKAGVEDYLGISVVMADRDCKIKIETEAE